MAYMHAYYCWSKKKKKAKVFRFRRLRTLHGRKRRNGWIRASTTREYPTLGTTQSRLWFCPIAARLTRQHDHSGQQWYRTTTSPLRSESSPPPSPLKKKKRRWKQFLSSEWAIHHSFLPFPSFPFPPFTLIPINCFFCRLAPTLLTGRERERKREFTRWLTFFFFFGWGMDQRKEVFVVAFVESILEALHFVGRQIWSIHSSHVRLHHPIFFALLCFLLFWLLCHGAHCCVYSE